MNWAKKNSMCKSWKNTKRKRHIERSPFCIEYEGIFICVRVWKRESSIVRMGFSRFLDVSNSNGSAYFFRYIFSIFILVIYVFSALLFRYIINVCGEASKGVTVRSRVDVRTCSEICFLNPIKKIYCDFREKTIVNKQLLEKSFVFFVNYIINKSNQ